MVIYTRVLSEQVFELHIFYQCNEYFLHNYVTTNSKINTINFNVAFEEIKLIVLFNPIILDIQFLAW